MAHGFIKVYLNNQKSKPGSYIDLMIDVSDIRKTGRRREPGQIGSHPFHIVQTCETELLSGGIHYRLIKAGSSSVIMSQVSMSSSYMQW